MADETPDTDILTLTAEIVAAYLGKASHVNAADIPAIIKGVRAALEEVGAPVETSAEPATTKPTKAQVRKSITPDALISFVDGRPYKTLKRHLARHGMDVKAYQAAYGLPSDYPSVAPNYSALRSEAAKARGLGARGRTGKEPEAPEAESEMPMAEPEVPTVAEKPAKAPRARKVAAEPAATE